MKTFDNDNIPVVYAVDKKVSDRWETTSQTNLTFDNAVNIARSIYYAGYKSRIMAWTAEDGYWLVAIYQ